MHGDSGSRRGLAFALLVTLCGCHLVAGIDDLEVGDEGKGATASAGSSVGGSSTSSSSGQGPGGSGACTTELELTKDSSINSLNPTQNDGDAPVVSVSHTLQNLETRTLVAASGFDAFDFGDPAVTAALCLYHADPLFGLGGPEMVRVHPLLRAWEEAAVTWQGTGSDGLWTVPGGDFDGPTFTEHQVNGQGLEDLRVCFDVTPLVAGVGDTGFGFILLAPAGNVTVAFKSSEFGVEMRRPVVEVNHPCL